MKWIEGNIRALSKEQYAALYRSLSASRRARIDRLRREDDRARSLCGEWLLRQLLSERGATDATVEAALNGRPFVRGAAVCVSVAHCEDTVVCAIGDTPLGIDIERIRPVQAKLIHRVCTEREAAFVWDDTAPCATGTVTDTAVLARFFEVWTAKEAYFKKQGTGITLFDSVETLSLKRTVVPHGDCVIHIVE